jgi:hypothetical protein
MKSILELDTELDLQVLYGLVMQGKFQVCIDKIEYTSSKYVNNIIEKVLNLYLKSIEDDNRNNWDPRNFYAEDYRDIMAFTKNVLRKLPNDIYKSIEDKEELILDIVYPYKIKKETIKLLIEQKEKYELCDNCFEHRIYTQYIKQNLKPEDDIVCYDMIITGKVNENSIKEIKIDIDRYLD